MKKTTLAMLMALSTGLIASENMYVGLDVGTTQLEVQSSLATTLSTGESGSINAKEKSSGISPMVKVGYMFNDNNRVMAFYQNIQADENKGSMYGVGYDYLFGASALKPFIGVFIGQTTIDGSVKIIGDDTPTSFDISGMNYGAQAGINYALYNNFSLEAGYRYIKAGMEKSNTYNGPEVTGYSYLATLTETLKTDAMVNVFVGVNYRF